MTIKPVVKLSGTDGNVFAVIGRVAKALRAAGLEAEAREFTSRAMAQASYDAVLALCFEVAEVE